MIMEYMDGFDAQFQYKYLPRKVVRDFEEYLVKNNIPLHDAYDNIRNFSESRSVTRKTQRAYRTRLRRFVEYIYEEKGITPGNEGKQTIMVGDGK